MPRTKSAIARKAARQTNDQKTQITNYGTVHSIIERDKVSPYQMMTGLSREELCDCMEYIFILRELYGLHGFIRPISGFSTGIDAAWSELTGTPLIGLFHGRKRGFMRDWMTETLYRKLIKADANQWSQFLTYFDTNPQYREEILTGKLHRAILSSMPVDVITGWLMGE